MDGQASQVSPKLCNQMRSGASGHPLLSTALVVAALGNFVDVYDLVLFLVVKNQSLLDLGVFSSDLLSSGSFILNCQMIGMLLGGVLWGILGDRIGRTKVLFGSIALYSIANLLNAAVHSIESYSLLRFIAGVGLAGELGAGVTLVSEVLPVRLRGYGTTIIACVGLLGAIAAGLTGDLLSWRLTYVVGGSLGLLLLFLRVSVAESEIFRGAQERRSGLRDFLLIFVRAKILKRFIACVVAGVPIWFTVGIILANAKEIARLLGVQGELRSGISIAVCYSGLFVGDMLGGVLSQYLQSRKMAIGFFVLLSAVFQAIFLTRLDLTIGEFYSYLFALGFSSGYWVLIVTVSAEQFGTDIRATVTTSIPNFIRGSIVPVSAFFLLLKQHFGIVDGALILGVMVSLLATICLSSMDETFSRRLDFLEG